MKISYCICSHNETDTLSQLLEKLVKLKCSNDEIVVIDDFSDSEETKAILNNYKCVVKIVEHALDKNYGAHKNEFGNHVSGDYIFQCDADEFPGDYVVGENLHNIIEVNPGIELIFVPRINDFRGVTWEHARQWGWKLTEVEFYRPSERKRVRSLVVNAPDYQGRIYKNEPSRIRWDRRLHEKIEGHTSMAILPPSEEFALYHDKTIEKQMETNKRYNVWFTDEENRGHDVFSKKV
jgi:glycosyltransferase involved in cell wall biosynthesis